MVVGMKKNKNQLPGCPKLARQMRAILDQRGISAFAAAKKTGACYHTVWNVLSRKVRIGRLAKARLIAAGLLHPPNPLGAGRLDAGGGDLSATAPHSLDTTPPMPVRQRGGLPRS
jgi:lambda repressor-like predicted transcriptional regulator